MLERDVKREVVTRMIHDLARLAGISRSFACIFLCSKIEIGSIIRALSINPLSMQFMLPHRFNDIYGIELELWKESESFFGFMNEYRIISIKELREVERINSIKYMLIREASSDKKLPFHDEIQSIIDNIRDVIL